MLATLTVRAGAIRVPWECGFEADETVEMSEWVLNPGTPNATDKWCIGRAIRSTGKQSLYISTTGGEIASYGNHPNIVMAYRRISFPELTQAKEYDISFDWRSPSESGVLYVFFDYSSKLLDGTDNILQYATANYNPVSNTIPQRVLNNAQYVSSGNYARTQTMSRNATWINSSIDAGAGTTYSVRMTANNSKKEFALVFVWINTNSDSESLTTGACIDNIQISSATARKPQNLKATPLCADSAITLTWEGGLNGYEVGYRKTTSSVWRRYTINSTPGLTQTYTQTDLVDGRYDFRVRGWKKISATEYDTTGYVTLSNILLYCPENSCVNYMDLDNAECGFGPKNDFMHTQKKVDYGSDDILSLHTVNTDPNEYDIRTGGLLPMVPKNAMGSVRLGNWNTPGTNKTHPDNTAGDDLYGSSIVYKYIVDTMSSSLLMIEYAMVLEAAGHSHVEQPLFTVTVLDPNGDPVSGGCGSREFRCPTEEDENMQEIIKRENWHIFSKDDFPVKNKDLGFNSNDIYWKEWTPMGVNLSDYHDKEITIIIESSGCTQGGHYGYGYFTISCARASIETEQCGDKPMISAEAPEGFAYQWYREKDKDIYDGDVTTRDPSDGHLVVVSTSAEFEVERGTDETFICRMFYEDAPECYFELSTRLSPRNPMAAFDTLWVPEDCQNIMRFIDKSQVIEYQKDGSYKLTGLPCEYSEWNVRSLISGERIRGASQTLEFPALITGDSLEITQIAYMADGECDDYLKDTIVVGSIFTPDSLIEMTICDNQYVEFDGEKRMTTGLYLEEYKNQYGCDSLIYLDLTVNPTSKINTVDTISDEMLPFEFHGLYEGRDTLIRVNESTLVPLTKNYQFKLRNHYDCDSTINIRLTIVPVMHDLKVDTLPLICADAGIMELGYEKSKGDFDSLVIAFDELAHQEGIEDMTILHDPYTNPMVEGESFVIPFDATIKPNHYRVEMRFYQHQVCGEPKMFSLPVEIRYASSVIEQKWNDVLVVRNADYNGGYTIKRYQWFKNGLPIEGATQPYLYTPLDFTAEYNVLLHRDDDVLQYTCPVVPVDRSGKKVSDFPTVAQVRQRIRVQMPTAATIRCYAASGVLVGYVKMAAGENSLTMPSNAGCYILRIDYTDGKQDVCEMLIVP